MNELNPDQNFDYESDENSDGSRVGPNSDDGYSVESIASQNQYYGRWAAEKWLLRVYLRRCCRFLLSKFRPEKPDDSTSEDELPF